MLYRSIEVTIQPYQISFPCQRFISGGQIVDSSRYQRADGSGRHGKSRRVGIWEKRSGRHQFAPFVADGEEERGEERERERESVRDDLSFQHRYSNVAWGSCSRVGLNASRELPFEMYVGLL